MKPEELKNIRHSTGLTQVQFAKALNVTFCTLNRWENGHVRILKKHERAIRAMQCRKKDAVAVQADAACDCEADDVLAASVEGR